MHWQAVLDGLERYTPVVDPVELKPSRGLSIFQVEMVCTWVQPLAPIAHTWLASGTQVPRVVAVEEVAALHIQVAQRALGFQESRLLLLLSMVGPVEQTAWLVQTVHRERTLHQRELCVRVQQVAAAVKRRLQLLLVTAAQVEGAPAAAVVDLPQPEELLDMEATVDQAMPSLFLGRLI
jgi:hypothetical protein